MEKRGGRKRKRRRGCRTGPHGTFKCGDCPRCPWVLEGRNVILPNGELFHSRTNANCGTRGVIYLMVCQCQAFYVGKTIREFRQRIGDHLYYSGIGRHIDLHHRYDLSVIRFLVLEVVPSSPRGGDWDRVILQRETLWIEHLNATTHSRTEWNELIQIFFVKWFWLSFPFPPFSFPLLPFPFPPSVPSFPNLSLYVPFFHFSLYLLMVAPLSNAPLHSLLIKTLVLLLGFPLFLWMSPYIFQKPAYDDM